MQYLLPQLTACLNVDFLCVTVENKNAGTPEEFQALQSKLTSVNKTVQDIKTGKYGLEVLNRSIVNMQKEVRPLHYSLLFFFFTSGISKRERKKVQETESFVLLYYNMCVCFMLCVLSVSENCLSKCLHTCFLER